MQKYLIAVARNGIGHVYRWPIVHETALTYIVQDEAHFRKRVRKHTMQTAFYNFYTEEDWEKSQQLKLQREQVAQYASNVIRCVNARAYYAIRDNQWFYKTVNVYYAFNNYRDDIAQVNQLATAIKAEHPEISEKDMHVHFVRYSSRHANFTTVQIEVDANFVREHMDLYTIL